MALHHHLHHAHHHVHHHLKKASRSFLTKNVEHHPILMGALVLIGGVAVLKAFTAKQSTTSSTGAA